MAGVMDLYTPHLSMTGLGGPAEGPGVPAPPGFSLPPGVDLSVLGSLTQLLSLVELGVYTTWGFRDQGDAWEAVPQPPAVNLSIAQLPGAALDMVPTLMFGQRLPWVAVIADVNQATGLPAVQDVEAALEGTPYELFQTLAVYSQADKAEPPTIRLLHWARLRDQASPGGGGSMDIAAAKLGGQLVYAQQVDHSLTRMRGFPAMSFDAALAAQMGLGSGPTPQPPITTDPDVPITPGPPVEEGPPDVAPPGEEVAPPPAKAQSKITPIMIGVGAIGAALGFVIVRSMRRKR